MGGAFDRIVSAGATLAILWDLPMMQISEKTDLNLLVFILLHWSLLRSAYV